MAAMAVSTSGRRRKKEHTIRNATPVRSQHKTSIYNKLVPTRSCAPPRIRESLLSQPRPSPETLRAAQYLPEKPVRLTKLPNERRQQMRLVQQALMRAKFSPTSTRRRPPATLKLTRNINNSKII